MCQSRSGAGRIFSDTVLFAGSTIEAARRAYNFVACNVIPSSKAFGSVSAGSLPQATKISEAINARSVSVRPSRLLRVTANQIETDKLKTFVGVSHIWPRD